MQLIKHGSVKDIYTGLEKDELVFKFSDRYSVFDWGNMPDELKNKGRSLAFMCGLFFEALTESKHWKDWFGKNPQISSHLKQGLMQKGLRGHYISALSDKDEKCDLFSVGKGICVRKVNVPNVRSPKGGYDYTAYQSRPTDTLVPLEVIFRHGIPSGSSLLKRVNDRDYLVELGLNHVPNEGEWLESPVVEVSTKLESTDRYIKRDEALTISGMSEEEYFDLRELVRLLSLRLRSLFASAGLELWDGKFEFAFGEEVNGKRDLILVDSIGPDEVRVMASGKHLSKELLRQFYRKTPWADDVEKAKKIAKERSSENWKGICIEELKSSPIKLNAETKELAETLYQALSNQLAQEIYGRPIFAGVEKLESLLERL